MNNQDHPEEWRTIGYAPLVGRYEVSNYGRVRSLYLNGGRPRKTPYLLKPSTVKSGGHAMYSLYRDNKQHAFLAGRLVLLTFVGPPPEPSHEASHLDGNSRNDFVDNLIWETHVDNERRKIEHGTRFTGHVQPKLNEQTVIDLRQRYRNGETAKKMASELDVSPSTVCNAINGKTWKHIREGR